jgi:hypothetical protein
MAAEEAGECLVEERGEREEYAMRQKDDVGRVFSLDLPKLTHSLDEKAGFLSIKSGNKKTKQIGKKEVYCLTAGSTLHCYKNPLETDVIESVELKVLRNFAVDPMKSNLFWRDVWLRKFLKTQRRRRSLASQSPLEVCILQKPFPLHILTSFILPIRESVHR